jgi:hypothetical protein
VEQADIIYNLAFLSISGRVILQLKILNAAGELNVSTREINETMEQVTEANL